MRRRHRIPWKRGESLAALQRHVGNYVALDPSVPHVGWPKEISRLTRGIWAEYERDPQGVTAQARRAYVRITEGGP